MRTQRLTDNAGWWCGGFQIRRLCTVPTEKKPRQGQPAEKSGPFQPPKNLYDLAKKSSEAED